MFSNSELRIDVSKLQEMANELIRAHQPKTEKGTILEAMKVIERSGGPSYSFLWSLIYRPRKDQLMKPVMALITSYRKLCESQIAKLEEEIRITEAVCGDDVGGSDLQKARALVQKARETLPKTQGLIDGRKARVEIKEGKDRRRSDRVVRSCPQRTANQRGQILPPRTRVGKQRA